MRRFVKIAVAVGLVVAALALAAMMSSPSDWRSALHALRPEILAIGFVALLANALAASLRLRMIAADAGYRLSFPQSMAAVGIGSLGGAVFFQLAGQLIARSAYLGKHGVAPASVIAITGYERIIAAGTSAVLAAAGAFFIFGGLAWDLGGGGMELVRILIGLLLAITAGAAIGFPRLARRVLAKAARREVLIAVGRGFVLTLLVQAPMMAAYVIVIASLAPTIDIFALIAATTIVMFAASIPVSPAGWGLREMSAVMALGAIGVGASEAFIAAVLVGLGSLLSMMALCAIAARALSQKPATPANHDVSIHRNESFARLLAIVICLGSALLIPFQLRLPTESGFVNANLADPLAILAGGYVAAAAWMTRRPPAWAFPHTATVLLAYTAVLTLSLFIGYMNFGWTDWALINRYLGWFILLGFFLAGTMTGNAFRSNGPRIVAYTLAGAIAAVCLLDLALFTFARGGVSIGRDLLPIPVAGFAQNRNAFAFQILIAASLLIAFHKERSKISAILLIALGAALIISGSRAGWGAAMVLLALAVVFKSMTLRSAAMVAVGSIIVGLAPTIVGHIVLLLDWQSPEQAARLARRFGIVLTPEAHSTDERISTFTGGLRLFFDHSILGAGLGAFAASEVARTGAVDVIHSIPVWLLAEFGIVGSAIVLTPLGMLLLVAVRRAWHGETAAKVVVFSFAVLAITGLAHDMLYQRIFWFIFGVAVSVSKGRIRAHSNGRGPEIPADGGPARQRRETRIRNASRPTLPSEG